MIALAGNKLDLVEEGDATRDSTTGASLGGDQGDADDADTAVEGEDGATAGVGADDGAVRKVSTSEARSFAEEEGLLFFETSAKTGHNVADVFAKIAEAIPETSLKGRGAAAQGTGAAGQQGAGAGGARGADGGRVDLGKMGERGGAKEGCAC